jgi:hypothetical protein
MINSTDTGCVLVLGMHRSGTSCLAGCLEQCGLRFDHVSRFNKFNKRGNLESLYVNECNESILRSLGGSWLDPPVIPPGLGEGHVRRIRDAARRVSRRSPCGIKDPRLLLLLEAWVGVLSSPKLIGTFRHPELVARSLFARDRLPASRAYQLWNRYNERLVGYHERWKFPLIHYDLNEPGSYVGQVALGAWRLGLDADPGRIRRFVASELQHFALRGDLPLHPGCRETYEYLIGHVAPPGSPPGPDPVDAWDDRDLPRFDDRRFTLLHAARHHATRWLCRARSYLGI